MMLSARVKLEVTRNIEKYEGRVPHLYLDTRGYVTVGVGHMLPNKSAVAEVTLYKQDLSGQLAPATVFEKNTEYDAVKNLPFGRAYSANYYKEHVALFMRDEDINFQRDKHVQAFYKELVSHYSVRNGFATEFDDMPAEVQMALFDMIFNLGFTKLRVQYVLFNGHLRVEQWAKAALQSNRLGISATRNQYVSDLLKAAEKSKQPAL